MTDNPPLERTDPVERVAELEAENLRLKVALEPKRQHGEIERIKKLVRSEPEALAYLNEMEAAVRFYKGLSDRWRGIASAMGYEPKAHDSVKPTEPWLLERIAKFRAALQSSVVTEGPGPWEAVAALVKSADAAAAWITEARKRAREEGTTSSLPFERNVAPMNFGAREVRNLRAAIRTAKAALAMSAKAMGGE